jgi:ACS family tartrate transporter-like MFS transporter
MIGSTNGVNGNFTRGLYLVGGTLVVSAVTIVVMRFAVDRPTNRNFKTRKAL